MCNKDYEVWKCSCLVRALLKRNQNPERALEIYNRIIFNQAMTELKIGDINGSS